MKRKSQSDDVDDYVMIKCQRFIFAPKDNKLINFCYQIGDGSESEDESVGVVPEERESDDPNGPKDPKGGSENGPGECKVNDSVKKEDGPVIELVEDLILTPVVSDSILTPVGSDSILTPVVSRESLPSVSEKLQITDSQVPPETRPETPKMNPTTVPEPESPEENRMLRKMRISDGTYTVEKAKFLEFIRAKAAIEEEKKMLKQYWQEFDARVEMMAQLEQELKGQLEAVFQTRVNEMMTAMGQVEEVYQAELVREREMRRELEGKVNEMAGFIQQNLNNQQVNSAHQQAEQQQHQYQELARQQQEEMVRKQQQEELARQQQLMELERRQAAFETEQQAERIRQMNAGISQNNLQNQLNQFPQIPQNGLKGYPEPEGVNWLGQPMLTSAQLEMEERREKEMRLQSLLQEERQKEELERQRLEAQKIEEQRRLEMRKMQYMRQGELAKQKAAEEARAKVKEEQNRLYAIQEEKKTTSFDPFALLKKMPNVFGWKGSEEKVEQSGTSANANANVNQASTASNTAQNQNNNVAVNQNNNPVPSPSYQFVDQNIESLVNRKAVGVQLSPLVRNDPRMEALLKESAQKFDAELFRMNMINGIRVGEELNNNNGNTNNNSITINNTNNSSNNKRTSSVAAPKPKPPVNNNMETDQPTQSAASSTTGRTPSKPDLSQFRR